MKMILIFEDKEILLETPSEISVKALKKQLSSQLSINTEKLSIMNNKEVLDDNYLINNVEGSKKFIILKSFDAGSTLTSDEEKNFVLQENDDIEELIMKVTGAKKRLVFKKGRSSKNKLNSIESKLETMNQLFSRFPPQRGSSLLRQEFENIIAQTNHIRESINFEENINNLGTSSNLYSPFNISSHNNPILNTILQNQSLESNHPGQSVSNNNSNTSANSNFNFNHYIPQLIPFRRPSVQADFQSTKSLVDMGFSEDQAKRALSMTGNNLNSAADLLLSNYNLDDIVYAPSYSNRLPSKIFIL